VLLYNPAALLNNVAPKESRFITPQPRFEARVATSSPLSSLFLTEDTRSDR
jgi:hypothetical protein